MRHRDIFLAALDLPAAERAAFLDRACASDSELRRLVEELLLSHDEAGSFLEYPAFTDQTRTAGDGVAMPGQGAADDLSFLAPPRTPDCLGRLGHYDVREVVGRGGMGVVLKATDTKLQRVVAIKVLATQLAASGTAQQRFLREAHAAAAVRDDHVVGIYAVGDEGPVPYLVMEYIAGITLDDRIKQGGSLNVKEVLRIGMQIARGLAAAHAQGLIHRDVKPANILLENGVQRVKLTDFGLARAADDASLTQSGVIAGTPMYMSPEQAEGRPVDPRTDLFSLGSVLYAMCTGRPPFRAESTMAVLKRVCEETPRPIREVNADIPDWLAAIVMKLLAKEPAQRFPSAAAVAELLAQYLAHVQQPHLIPRPPSVADTEEVPRRLEQTALNGLRLAILGMARFGVVVSLPIAVLGLLLAVWFAVQLLRDRGNQTAPGDDRGKKEEPFRPPPRLTPEELAKLPSPLDGRKRDDIPPALLTLVGGGDPAQAPPELVAALGDGRFVLPGDGLTSWMAPSPDGKLLAVPRGSNVVLFDAVTGAVVRTLVGRGTRAYGAAFSPDGRRLASGTTFHGDGSITVWDVKTGQVVHVLKGHSGDVWRTAFSGDGKRLVSGSSDRTAKVWDVEKGVELFTLRGQKETVYALAFSPDGRSVLTGSNDGTVRVWDARTGQLSKTLRMNGDHVWDLVYSPDGKLLAGGGWNGWKLWDAKTFEEVRSGAEAAPWLAFSADSRVLLTGRHDNRDGAAHAVSRWDVASGDKLGTLPLKSAGGWAFYALSPDTKTLYAMSGDPPDPFVRSHDAQTGKELFPHQGHTGKVWTVAFSPDGKRLASAGQDGAVRVWDLAAWKPGEPLPPTYSLGNGRTGTVYSVAFSPDSKLLAAIGSDGFVNVWNVVVGGSFRTLPGRKGGGSNLAFSPDGKTLAVGWNDGSVWRWDLASGKGQEPLRWHAGVVNAVAYSPDGRFLAAKGETDQTVCLADAATGQLLQTIRDPAPAKRHPDFGLAFSPDSRTLAITAEKDVRLYDLETKKETTLRGHTDWLHGIAFHPAGRFLASASDDHTVRLWDLSSPGRVLTIGPGPFGHMAREVAFDPTGRYFATSNWNGTVTIFRTPTPPVADARGSPKKLPDPKELAAKPAAADALKRDDIPPGQRKGLPPEVVAVLGGPAFALPPENKAGPMAVSADGKRLAVPSYNKVVLFDAHSGRHLRTLTGHTSRVFCIAFSPDGKRLAAANRDPKVPVAKVWDVRTGEQLQEVGGHTNLINAIAFSPDGKRLATASFDGTVKVFADGKGGQLVGVTGRVYAVTFSPDGKWLVTAGEDKGARVWDATTGKPVRTLKGLTKESFLSLTYSPGGKLLAGVGNYGWKLWDADTFNEVRSVEERAGWLAFAPDAKSLLTGRLDYTGTQAPHVVKRWSIEGKELASFQLKGKGGWAAYALSPDGKTLFEVTIPIIGDSTLRTYDAATGTERAAQGHTGGLTTAAVSPDGTLLASAGEDSVIKLWDLATGEVKQALRGHAGKVVGVAFSPDGKRLASIGEDGTLRLWDTARGKELATLERGRAHGWGVVFSPDGRWLAVPSNSDGGVRLWDAKAGKPGRVLRGPNHALRPAFSPDGRLLACGGDDGTVRLWDVAGGWQVRELHGPGNVVMAVGFSPDGRVLAAGSADGAVKRWDVTTGDEVGSPWKFAGAVDGVAFSPDGRLFAASSWDGTVRLSDLTARPPRERTVRLPAVCAGAVFTPEGRYLAVPCNDGLVYVLRLAERGKVFEIVDR